MKNIVFLLNAKLRNSIFKQEDIDALSQIGNIVFNMDEQGPDADKVKELIRDANIAITSWGCPRLDRDILQQAPGLELIVHAAGSVKGIVSDEVWRRKIRVSSCAYPLGIGVAETALGFTITALKNMWDLARNTREGKWDEGREKVREVYGVTIGVIGAGRAGRHYIKLMKNFDVDILLYDPTVDEQQAQEMGVQKVELEELLKRSDVVSIHAPSIPETYHMINRETLMLMKDDAIIINTARGSLIDEEALVEELRKGRLFACIDVTDPEPPDKGHPFRSLPNVILTPHIAGAVNNGLYRIGKYVVEEILAYVKGEKMDGEVFENKLSILA